jgi:hypothetical protein
MKLKDNPLQKDRTAEQIYPMKRYRDGFERLAASVRDKPDYPDTALARVDMADLEHRLA